MKLASPRSRWLPDIPGIIGSYIQGAAGSPRFRCLACGMGQKPWTLKDHCPLDSDAKSSQDEQGIRPSLAPTHTHIHTPLVIQATLLGFWCALERGRKPQQCLRWNLCLESQIALFFKKIFDYLFEGIPKTTSLVPTCFSQTWLIGSLWN